MKFSICVFTKIQNPIKDLQVRIWMFVEEWECMWLLNITGEWWTSCHSAIILSPVWSIYYWSSWCKSCLLYTQKSAQETLDPISWRFLDSRLPNLAQHSVTYNIIFSWINSLALFISNLFGGSTILFESPFYLTQPPIC